MNFESRPQQFKIKNQSFTIVCPHPAAARPLPRGSTSSPNAGEGFMPDSLVCERAGLRARSKRHGCRSCEHIRLQNNIGIFPDSSPAYPPGLAGFASEPSPPLLNGPILHTLRQILHRILRFPGTVHHESEGIIVSREFPDTFSSFNCVAPANRHLAETCIDGDKPL